MTAVLSATDAFRRDRVMASHDDNQINYSPSNGSVDWKEKYIEAADMLAETRAELDEFQRSSRELEEELVRELEHNEKSQQDLRVKVARTESEREEWKSKFMQLQTTHNTTTTSLQRELDQLRQGYQQLKVQMRELEMGNDDLERNERAVSSSLADVEAKYARALEEKILLEQELLDKASLEEECQRLKDEVRDANTEINVLREQLSTAHNRVSSLESIPKPMASSLKQQVPSSDEDIMKVSPPEDIMFTDVTTGATSSSEPSPASDTSVKFDQHIPTLDAHAGQSVLLKRAGFSSQWTPGTPPSGTRMGLTRSTTMATYSPSRLPTSIPMTRPTASQRYVSEPLVASTSTTVPVPITTTTTTTSRSRGVQMVSEMRARVRNLEQKLHTRVPRLRMGSISGRTASNSATSSVANLLGMNTGGSDAPKKRRSADLEGEKKRAPSNQGKGKSGHKDKDTTVKDTSAKDNSGWVLIMEDNMTPTPILENGRENGRRRLSSPTVPYLPSIMANKAYGSTTNLPLTGHTGGRRPQSRLSIGTADGRDSYGGRDSTSTVSTTSSIPTPTSRPATPTFLPIPSSGSYTSGLPHIKRPTGPVVKRSSLGANAATTGMLHPPEMAGDIHTPVPLSVNRSMGPPNVTVRIPRPPSVLGQSRIMRPSSLGSGRKSTGPDDEPLSR